MCCGAQWQVCAAKGWLAGQNSRRIRFARDLDRIMIGDYQSNPELGVCSGWTDVGCDESWGFANDDVPPRPSPASPTRARLAFCAPLM